MQNEGIMLTVSYGENGKYLVQFRTDPATNKLQRRYPELLPNEVWHDCEFAPENTSVLRSISHVLQVYTTSAQE